MYKFTNKMNGIFSEGYAFMIIRKNEQLALRIILNPYISGLVLAMRPANQGRCYKVTASLIGWAQAWNQPCTSYINHTSGSVKIATID